MNICDHVCENRAYAIKIGNWVSGGFCTELTSCTFVVNLKPIALFFVEIQLLLWWSIRKVIIAEWKVFFAIYTLRYVSAYLSVIRIDSIKRSWTLSCSQSTQEAVKQGPSSLQEAVKQGPSSLEEAFNQGPSSLLRKLSSKGHRVYGEAVKRRPSSLQEAVKQGLFSLLRKLSRAFYECVFSREYLQMPCRMPDQHKDALWG